MSVVPLVISNHTLCDATRRVLHDVLGQISAVKKINIRSISWSQKHTKVHRVFPSLLILEIFELYYKKNDQLLDIALTHRVNECALIP